MGYITEKQFKYFSCEYRKAANFGKLYFLPKLIKSYIMSKDDQLFRIAAHTHTQENAWIFKLSLETFNAEVVVVH